VFEHSWTTRDYLPTIRLQLTLMEEGMGVRIDKQPRLFPLVETERCRMPESAKQELVSLLARLIESVAAARQPKAQERGGSNE